MNKKTRLQNIYEYFLWLDRIGYIRWFFMLGFLYVLFTTGRYTILEHGYFTKLADAQQLREQVQSVNRGEITTSDGSTLVRSAHVFGLAVDPTEIGSRENLETFLTDITYSQFCELSSKKECFENILSFLKVYDLEDFSYELEYIKNILREEIVRRLDKKYIDAVLIMTDLSKEQKEAVESLNNPGLYFYTNHLYGNPEFITHPEVTSTQLSEILNLDVEIIQSRIRLRPDRHVEIISKLDSGLKQKIETQITEEYSKVIKGEKDMEESIYRYIIFDPKPNRFYQEHEIIGPVVGFVNKNNYGQYGLEEYFNTELQGKSGSVKVRKTESGKIIETLSKEEIEEIQGANITLTIDRNIQKAIYDILEYDRWYYQANSASAIVIEPTTGKILSMVSVPSFDPAHAGNTRELERFETKDLKDPIKTTLGIPIFVEDVLKWKSYVYAGEIIYLREATDEEIMDPNVTKYKFKNDFWDQVYKNITITNQYEPGSVFKTFTVAIGIDTGEITPNEFYYDRGKVIIDNFTIENVDNDKCQGTHMLRNALNFSCNVGMVYIVEKIGKSILYEYLKNLGFGEKTGIQLSHESAGTLTHYKKWSRAQLLTSSYGIGLNATMLQMAAAYGTIANKGIYMRPYIVEDIEFSNGKTIHYDPEPLRRVFKESTTQQVVSMLVEGTRIGFANSGAVSGYDIAGKTGTSQIAKAGGYEKGESGRTITSFGGFAPAQDPKFVVIVRFDRPRIGQYSSKTASPTFSRITEFLLNYYNIPAKTMRAEYMYTDSE